MDELILTVYDELELGEVGRSLWEPALPHLARLVSGGDDEYSWFTCPRGGLQGVCGSRPRGPSQVCPGVAFLQHEFAAGNAANYAEKSVEPPLLRALDAPLPRFSREAVRWDRSRVCVLP